MTTAPWWWVPLITVIGTPLLGALLYFFVPLLRVAKRLGIWLSNPPWWVQNIFAALLVGVIVASVSILWQKRISDASAAQATRLENLRFVRQLSLEKDAVARPFDGLDLQGQNLRRLNLTGANLEIAKLQDADLSFSFLACNHVVPHCANLNGADLTGAVLVHTNLDGAYLARANLTNARVLDSNLAGANLSGANLERAVLTGTHLSGADLTGANLTDADLTGVHYDEKTKWPVGFKPPPSAKRDPWVP
jgi:uncharacterized protein YjbI with pentapeptide repeats